MNVGKVSSMASLASLPNMLLRLHPAWDGHSARVPAELPSGVGVLKMWPFWVVMTL